MSFLGLTVTEYSSGDRQHRGHLTKTGNRHARRLLIEAAWHYRHPPRLPRAPHRARRARPARRRRARLAGPDPPAPPPPPPHQPRQALTVANAAVARELAGFLWAAMTHQPLREELAATA